MAKLTVNVDGGARGNPGPAAIGVVVRDAGGEVLEERGERIGRATNNVAEYRALLRGIELAAAHGASELELVGDSELVVRQVEGRYKVKDATMKRAARRGEARRWRTSRAGRSATSAASRTPTPTASSTRRSTAGGSGVPDRSRADRPRRRHRPRPPQGRRRRPRPRLLLRRARLRADAALRRRRGLRLRRRLPPPHRPQLLGVERRLAAAAGDDRALPHRDPLPDPPRPRRRPAAADRGRGAR